MVRYSTGRAVSTLFSDVAAVVGHVIGTPRDEAVASVRVSSTRSARRPHLVPKNSGHSVEPGKSLPIPRALRALLAYEGALARCCFHAWRDRSQRARRHRALSSWLTERHAFTQEGLVLKTAFHAWANGAMQHHKPTWALDLQHEILSVMPGPAVNVSAAPLFRPCKMIAVCVCSVALWRHSAILADGILWGFCSDTAAKLGDITLEVIIGMILTAVFQRFHVGAEGNEGRHLRVKPPAT